MPTKRKNKVLVNPRFAGGGEVLETYYNHTQKVLDKCVAAYYWKLPKAIDLAKLDLHLIESPETGQLLFVTRLMVGPDLARAIEKDQGLNRDLIPSNVQFLKEEMEDGEWTVTGESHLIYDSEGKNRNAKHTLRAIIQSGETVELSLTYGVSPTAYVKMGASVRRTFAQLLFSMDIPSKSNLASSIRFVMLTLSSKQAARGRKNRLSMKKAILFLKKNAVHIKTAVEATNIYQRQPKNMKVITGKYIAGLLYFLRKYDERLAMEYFNQLCTGIDTDGNGIKETSPVHKLRVLLLSNSRSVNRFNMEMRITHYIDGWNQFITGKEYHRESKFMLASYSPVLCDSKGNPLNLHQLSADTETETLKYWPKPENISIEQLGAEARRKLKIAYYPNLDPVAV